MTVIRPNSISGITSITAQANEINVFRSNGLIAGLNLNGVNFNTTAGISTLAALKVTGNVDIAGVLTYQDVTNVDSLGIGTFRTGINVSGGQLDVGSNIKLGNAGVITATSFSGAVSGTTGTFTGNVAVSGANITVQDSGSTSDDRITLGAGPDMQLYHNGTDSVITNATGDLYVNNNADIIIKPANDLFLKPQDGEDGIKVIGNGAVELYHDNVKALSTSSTGINVWGRSGNGILDIYPTGSALYSILNLHNTAGGTAYNAQLIASSGQSVYLGSGNTGDVVLRTGNSQNKVVCKHNGATELYHSSNKKFETTSTGVTISGNANFLNNNKIIIGTGADAEIFHNDTDFHIDAQASGGATRNIYMTCGTVNEGGFIVRSNAGDTMFKALTDSSCFLYFDNSLKFRTMTDHCEIRGHLLPDTNNTDDLGSSSKRFRNIYTNDLNLSNEGSTNSVDNTWGNYTIQEGESDLFLINNRNGKKYKFNLTEVS